MLPRRAFILGGSAAIFTLTTGCTSVRSLPIERRHLLLATGAKGGGFPVYGEALAATLETTFSQVRQRESSGTGQNINLLQAREVDAALLVMRHATSVANLNANSFMPFHPGALRYLQERGVRLSPGGAYEKNIKSEII